MTQHEIAMICEEIRMLGFRVEKLTTTVAVTGACFMFLIPFILYALRSIYE
jgi:hypothetical protein